MDRRRAEGGPSAQPRHHRAPLGKHLARQGLQERRQRFRHQGRELQDRSRRILRALRQGFQRAPRPGEGRQGRSLPRRRAPARLHHHAAAVRDRGLVQQGDQLRRARQREAGGRSAGQEERRAHPQRGVVEPAARRQERGSEALRRPLQGEIRPRARLAAGSRLRDGAHAVRRHHPGRLDR